MVKLHGLHSWHVSIKEAISLQSQLAPKVSCTSTIPEKVSHIAGVDISPPNSEGKVRAALVILSYPGLELEEVCVADGDPGLPYVPGLLSFREMPVIVSALERLKLTPDIIIADGQGLAHPRRFGIACHLGLWTSIPTIGCAKSILVGKHESLDREAGATSELVHRDEVVGMAVRTRKDVKPVYVSVGHKIDLDSAVGWVLASCTGKRLPETTRLAHKAAAGDIEPGLRGLLVKSPV